MATLLFKRGLRNQFIQGVTRLTRHSKPMVGQAFTLRHIAAREDIDVSPIFREPDHPQRVAIESVPAHDVLVMDCRGDSTAASLGGILATRLEVRACAGFVSDAGVRDSDYVAALDLPVYCAGRSAPTNLTRHHAVDMNVPVSCGGVPVYPGDVILGDGDGVIVIPLGVLDELLPQALAMEHFELFITALVRGGRPVIGTYPANEETLALYEEYKKTNPLLET
jgi:regulator of RNase E activity RraA